jgi:hypothetical protein
VSRLRDAFDRAQAEQRAALVAYLTFADPDPQTSISVVEAACRAGADVIELGVPFSDPSADGPSIQRAMERALAAGGSLPLALDAVAELRKRGIRTPIVLFGYYNPVFVMGTSAFARRAAETGVDAVLTVDLPIDELAELAEPLAAEGVDVIPLVAPTSTPDRIDTGSHCTTRRVQTAIRLLHLAHRCHRRAHRRAGRSDAARYDPRCLARAGRGRVWNSHAQRRRAVCRDRRRCGCRYGDRRSGRGGSERGGAGTRCCARRCAREGDAAGYLTCEQNGSVVTSSGVIGRSPP